MPKFGVIWGQKCQNVSRGYIFNFFKFFPDFFEFSWKKKSIFGHFAPLFDPLLGKPYGQTPQNKIFQVKKNFFAKFRKIVRAVFAAPKKYPFHEKYIVLTPVYSTVVLNQTLVQSNGL